MKRSRMSSIGMTPGAVGHEARRPAPRGRAGDEVGRTDEVHRNVGAFVHRHETRGLMVPQNQHQRRRSAACRAA